MAKKEKKIKAETPEEAVKDTAEETGQEAEAGNPDEPEEAEKAASEEGEEQPAEDPRDAKLKDLEDKVVRQMAEFDNFRKRTEKEKSEMFAGGEKTVIESILPVIDNFERALDMSGSAGNEAKEKDPFMEGMEMVYRQLMDELKKLGVEPIEALGADFDPNLHNAVMQEESEEYESGKVCKELQRGYTLNGSVVRHAMVSVAQ